MDKQIRDEQVENLDKGMINLEARVFRREALILGKLKKFPTLSYMFSFPLFSSSFQKDGWIGTVLELLGGGARVQNLADQKSEKKFLNVPRGGGGGRQFRNNS